MTNERKINCCSCGARTADYYFTAEPMGCGGIENWCFRCEDDLRENETDKLVRNIEQVYICQGCNCDINDDGFCSEGCTHGQDDDEDEDDEIQPHCQICFNMNSNKFVTKNALKPVCSGKCVAKLIEKHKSKTCDNLYNNFVIQEWDNKDDGTDGFSYIQNDANEEDETIHDQINNEINLNYENFNAKRSCMWVEEIKRRSKWVRGETIYGFNREKYCTYQICWSRDKTKIGFYNWILEADGYVSFLLCNGYTTDETANTKFKNYIRPSCLYNDKNSAIL